MSQDELDRILARLTRETQDLAPSAGFVERALSAALHAPESSWGELLVFTGKRAMLLAAAASAVMTLASGLGTSEAAASRPPAGLEMLP